MNICLSKYVKIEFQNLIWKVQKNNFKDSDSVLFRPLHEARWNALNCTCSLLLDQIVGPSIILNKRLIKKRKDSSYSSENTVCNGSKQFLNICWIFSTESHFPLQCDFGNIKNSIALRWTILFCTIAATAFHIDCSV
jgi:hypothetical protein